MQCDELKEHGASVGKSPAAVIKKCKYTIGMLSDPSAALSVSRDFNHLKLLLCYIIRVVNVIMGIIYLSLGELM